MQNIMNQKAILRHGGLGTMGFALPAAIGAKFGAPQREVIAIAGDGGFQMTLAGIGNDHADRPECENHRSE